jgi:hypothetical protein
MGIRKGKEKEKNKHQFQPDKPINPAQTKE